LRTQAVGHRIGFQGQWAIYPLVASCSRRPDAGVFIVDAICIRQVYYGIMGELKGKIEGMNGARECKMSYN
jgi:hypothetical protein